MNKIITTIILTSLSFSSFSAIQFNTRLSVSTFKHMNVESINYNGPQSEGTVAKSACVIEWESRVPNKEAEVNEFCDNKEIMDTDGENICLNIMADTVNNTLKLNSSTPNCSSIYYALNEGSAGGDFIFISGDFFEDYNYLPYESDAHMELASKIRAEIELLKNDDGGSVAFP